MKPEFGQIAGLAFFTTEKAMAKLSPSEYIRNPMIIAAARETPALQWTSTTPPFEKERKDTFKLSISIKMEQSIFSFTTKAS